MGQSHFIKTVEDLHEAIFNTVPGAKFGIAFGEASGDCLVRIEGNNDEMVELAGEKMAEIGCGHSFLIFLENAFPINVTQRIKSVPEVVNRFVQLQILLKSLLWKLNKEEELLGLLMDSNL